MRTDSLPIVLFFLLLLVLSGCMKQPASVQDASPLVAEVALQRVPNPRYTILAGDDLEIKLTYHPQYNERIEVLPDGSIFLPIVNVVTAAGKAPAELAQELKREYARELRDPEVVVIVRRSSGRMAYIGGEVRAPQAIPMAFPVSLLQAVVRCGDILPSAQERNVLVLRSVPGAAPQVLMADLAAIRKGRASDVLLEPYDIVHVPKTSIAQVSEFIDAYINRIIPKAVTFPFTYEIRSDVNR